MHVSIIVPVYNVSKYLTPCLDSLSAQTYKDIDIIFVDDCGQDNSVEIIRDYVDIHPFPKHQIISHEVNRGLSAARNTGLTAAKGDYVYFLDSDDEVSHDCIERLIKPCKEKDYDVIIGGVEEQYANGTTKHIVLQAGGIDQPLKSYADGNWYVMAWNKLCRKDFLLKNRLFFKEGLLHEDVVWSFKLACTCNTMYSVKDITYFYKIRSESIMTSMSIAKDASIYVRAFETIKAYISEKNLDDNPDVYRMVEGKKNGIMYSLLQVGQKDVFNLIYPSLHSLATVSPIKAFRRKQIGFGCLMRDFNYCLPVSLGRLYKRMFYFLFYGIRGKKIKGAVWK